MQTHDLSLTIRNNLKVIQDRIGNAAKSCGGNPANVQLIAVSKRVPVSVMQEAVDAGQTVFGESYVQEAASKFAELQGHARLDLIGHLQRNKARQAVGCFSLIHSVDSLPLARKLSSAALGLKLVQDILIQVNISGETQKSGVLPRDAEELCHGILGLEGVQLKGLMIIGQWMPEGVNEDVRRAEFRKTRELRDRLAQSTGLTLKELSMGMSGDFELAIEEGATLVRVGTALFGPRL